jgi:hypothetical protein
MVSRVGGNDIQRSNVDLSRKKEKRKEKRKKKKE